MVSKQLLEELEVILQEEFGVVLGNEETIDISSEKGKQLLETYNLTKVPTIILSADAADYTVLAQVWSNVGIIADDGSFIFTNMEQLEGAKYTDLEAEMAIEAGNETTE